MSKKKGPFDELIEMLRGLVWANQLQCNQAANVLEAAGRVDKKKAVRAASTVGISSTDMDGNFYPGESVWNQIRVLLESLPEKP